MEYNLITELLTKLKATQDTCLNISADFAKALDSAISSLINLKKFY